MKIDERIQGLLNQLASAEGGELTRRGELGMVPKDYVPQMVGWRPNDRLPPIWLSAAAVAAAVTAAAGVIRWVSHFESAPYAEDFRVYYVAAQIGMSHGWSHIYDLNLQAQGSALYGQVTNTNHNFVAPPLLAWLAVPLLAVPLRAAYVIWTLVSVGALVLAWLLACPGKGLQRATLLLIAFALWPVHYSFWLGQTVIVVLCLLAACWWLLARDRWLWAGVLLAVLLFMRPQSLLLLPPALLISGRWKPVAVCALVAAGLLLLTLGSLGPEGINSYRGVLAGARSDPVHSVLTFGYLFGQGYTATGVEVALGLVALVLARVQRARLDLVFALGIVGTAASASYFHEYDPSVLVIPAWIVLRNRPSTVHKAWLLLGIAAAQFISIGLPIPMLVWEALWLCLLGLEPALSRPALEPQPAADSPRDGGSNVHSDRGVHAATPPPVRSERLYRGRQVRLRLSRWSESSWSGSVRNWRWAR